MRVKKFCTTGISPTANIRTLCAWCASTPISERRMRTRAFAEWRKRHADSVNGIGKKEETHLQGVSLLFW